MIRALVSPYSTRHVDPVCPSSGRGAAHGAAWLLGTTGAAILSTTNAVKIYSFNFTAMTNDFLVVSHP